MPTTLATDLKVYPEQFWTGVTEVLQQQAEVFNGASRNAVRLVPARRRGDFAKEAFFKANGSLVTRRDPSGTGAVTPQKVSQDETVSVKVHRRIGPVDVALTALRQVDMSNEAFSLMLGRQHGVEIMLDYVNTSMIAAAAALGKSAATKLVAADATKHTHLVKALALFGDRSNRIRAWAGHSGAYFDLVRQAITDKIYNVADLSIVEGSTPTLNRPYVQTDSAAFFNATPTPDEYTTLGLFEGGVAIEQSEEQVIVSEIITGGENLVLRLQGEYAFNIRLKGFKWDTAAGGANPTDAALGTGANWVQTASSAKDTAGVMVVTQVAA